MQALVSIIIPTYNRAYLIGETLDSVLVQTFKEWECIVVDDGSSDHTAELLDFYIQKDPRFRFLKRPEEKPKGANACRNYGFEKSKGSFIQWFDSDDIMYPSMIEEKVAKTIEEDADACVSNVDYFENSPKELLYTFTNVSSSEEILKDYLFGKININTLSLLWRREILQNIHFNEALHRAQEIDFHFRILKEKKIRIAFIDKSLASIRGHKESITGNFKMGNVEAVHSELMLRKQILKYQLGEKYSHNRLIKSLEFYLRTLQFLSKYGTLSEVRRELNSLEEIVEKHREYYLWKWKLFLFILLFKSTGRKYQLKQHLFEFKDHVKFL